MSDHTIFPVLRYRDANAAIEWLKEALGATENVVHRDDQGGVAHAELVVEGQLVLLGQARDADFLGGKAIDPHASPISIYVVVADPEAHHERAAATGAEVVRPLERMDYGAHEYSLRDPEGNLWSFGTYAPSVEGG